MKAIVSFILMLIFAATTAQGDQIILRPKAKADGPVKLSDVAQLVGPEAKRMADAIVAPAGTTEVTMNHVRDAPAKLR